MRHDAHSRSSEKWCLRRTRTEFLIQILDDLNILTRLNGCKEKNSDLFQRVQERMARAGFCRTIEQIKNRWKMLKQSYNKAKTNNDKSGVDLSSFPFFEDMDRVLGTWPLATANAHGVDVAFDTEESRGSAEPETESVMDDETSDVTELCFLVMLDVTVNEACFSSLTSINKG
ncbi:hypothetical protein ABVT39_000542 [Epinephelus coioides]